jgi:prepilin-type N-terminal cleavage/methylation domain-containing protein
MAAHNRTRPRFRDARGFSLSELLTVVAIAGLVVAVSVPLVAQNVRQAKIRGAADQFTMSLRAARMIAVSKRATVGVTVADDPVNSYSFPDTRGTTRTVAMPDGVRIVSSDSPIAFTPNGSLSASTTTVLEADLTDGAMERWTVTTSVLGTPSVSRERIVE